MFNGKAFHYCSIINLAVVVFQHDDYLIGFPDKGALRGNRCCDHGCGIVFNRGQIFNQTVVFFIRLGIYIRAVYNNFYGIIPVGGSPCGFNRDRLSDRDYLIDHCCIYFRVVNKETHLKRINRRAATSVFNQGRERARISDTDLRGIPGDIGYRQVRLLTAGGKRPSRALGLRTMIVPRSAFPVISGSFFEVRGRVLQRLCIFRHQGHVFPGLTQPQVK